jgi:hypothetical protein
VADTEGMTQPGGDHGMKQATYFISGCTLCGRQQRLRIEQFGKPLRCKHCGGIYEGGPQSDRDLLVGQADGGDSERLAEKVERLLAAADRQLARFGGLLDDPGGAPAPALPTVVDGLWPEASESSP